MRNQTLPSMSAPTSQLIMPIQQSLLSARAIQQRYLAIQIYNVPGRVHNNLRSTVCKNIAMAIEFIHMMDIKPLSISVSKSASKTNFALILHIKSKIQTLAIYLA
jgi:hypothetical protein